MCPVPSDGPHATQGDERPQLSGCKQEADLRGKGRQSGFPRRHVYGQGASLAGAASSVPLGRAEPRTSRPVLCGLSQNKLIRQQSNKRGGGTGATPVGILETWVPPDALGRSPPKVCSGLQGRKYLPEFRNIEQTELAGARIRSRSENLQIKEDVGQKKHRCNNIARDGRSCNPL